MKLRLIGQLVGLGAALVILALAVGNSGQAQFLQNFVTGYYWEKPMREVYYVTNDAQNALRGLPSIFIEVNTGQDSGNVQVYYWDGQRWQTLGDPIPPNSSRWVRRPANGGIRASSLGLGGGNWALFRIGIDSWPDRARPNSDSSSYKLGVTPKLYGKCRTFGFGLASDKPQVVYLVGVERVKGIDTIHLPSDRRDSPPPGQGYIFVASPNDKVIACVGNVNVEAAVVGNVIYRAYWAQQ
jgi:hypothetical protein